MTLPLKVRMAIRSQWDNEDAPAQKAIKAVQTTLGKNVMCQPDFPVLYSELEGSYDEKSDLVTLIASAAHVWFIIVEELLDSTDNEAWSDKLLEIIEESSVYGLTLAIEVSKSTKTSTWWSPSRKLFILELPNEKALIATEFAASWKADLMTAFEPKDSGNEWTDVATEEPVVPEASSTYLPTIDQLPRPEDLLLRPPYRMIVHPRANSVEVQGSHSPSLELLAAYLQKWCKTNYSDTRQPPVLEVRLHASPFGRGGVYDRLTLSLTERQYLVESLSPMLVLNFIENVLEYKSTESSAGGWHFVRTSALKML